MRRTSRFMTGHVFGIAGYGRDPKLGRIERLMRVLAVAAVVVLVVWKAF